MDFGHVSRKGCVWVMCMDYQCTCSFTYTSNRSQHNINKNKYRSGQHNTCILNHIQICAVVHTPFSPICSWMFNNATLVRQHWPIGKAFKDFLEAQQTRLSSPWTERGQSVKWCEIHLLGILPRTLPPLIHCLNTSGSPNTLSAYIIAFII